MSVTFCCKLTAAALTFLNLRMKGVPFHVIASIPFPHLPGPPRHCPHVAIASSENLDGIRPSAESMTDSASQF